MSSFFWDMMGDRNPSPVVPNPREEAETSSSSGYSPSPSQDLRKNPLRTIPRCPPRSLVPSGSSAAPRLKDAAAEQPAEVPSSVPVAENEGLSPRDICSSMRARDVAKACEVFNIGPEFRARMARPEERMCTFFEGEIAVFVHNIRMGLRIPFNSFFRSLFLEYGLMPCQFTPNAYRCIVGFLEICRRMNIVPTVDLFHLIFLLISSYDPAGWYYFRFRMSSHSKMVNGRSSSVHNWKDKFFFISIPADWTFNRVWGKPSKRALAKPDPTLSEELKVARLRFGQFSGVVDVTHPSAEMLEGITRFLENLEG
jgi:hypothetical protein